jgi:anti-anti-sigma factor
VIEALASRWSVQDHQGASGVRVELAACPDVQPVASRTTRGSEANIGRSGDDLRTVRLELPGELDDANASAFREQMEQILATRPRRLVIDGSGLAFCDSTGLGSRLAACAAAERQVAEFQVVKVHAITRRTMLVTAVVDILTGEP